MLVVAVALDIMHIMLLAQVGVPRLLDHLVLRLFLLLVVRGVRMWQARQALEVRHIFLRSQ
ncbi:MAG: hypothetical protein COZ48_02825 [Candidatus Yonathbacteria bacterium CG_4_10_14_3_um_filter_43_12]|nr:MAG: hypothetical protein COZ48_02825 [Candidatus Yonathbacteria bacterium CG_4_10_14_3_um_filter_43_12]